MSIYDYITIGFYLFFMFLIGPIYKSFSKTSGDFFCGSGGMLWWVVGSSAWMASFSAWAFTGGAAKTYETGTFFLILFACNWIAQWFCYFLTAAKYRQMRIITPMEAIQKRFDNINEQIFTWLPIPFQAVFGGIGLYTIAVFMSGVFHTSMPLLIIVFGVVVTLMTLFGGSWAVTGGNFVQMLILLVITVTLSALTLAHPQVGGLSGFWDKIPPYHFEWTLFEQRGIIIFFAVTLFINQLIQMNALNTGAARYIFVKNGLDAKKAVLVSQIGGLILSPIWMIPAIVAVYLHPNLAAEYPQLNNPNEAAYVAMARDLLPPGLLGLLVCGIFAASMTTMNSTLNVVTGTFVRNFYIRIVKPAASEAEQIFVGRIFIFIYGIIWILLGLFFQQYKSLPLFDLTLLVAAAIGLPTAIPLFLCIFIKKTPKWAGWSSMVAGFAFSILIRFIFTDEFIKNLWGSDLKVQEIRDLNLSLTTAVVAAVTIGCFFLSMLFYKKDDKEYVAKVDRFFEEMNTPVVEGENEADTHEGDCRQYKVLGNLCVVYGVFVLLLILIPNKPFDRFLIFICGAIMTGIGIAIRLLEQYTKRKYLTKV